MTKPKPKVITPKAFYKIGEIYELTINPDNCHQYYEHINREHMCIKHMIKTMTPLIGYAEWELYPEISEATEMVGTKHGPRWHYHGKIKFLSNKGIVLFLLQHMANIAKQNSIKISEYRPDYWPQYIKKQSKVMQSYLKSINLVYQLNHKFRRTRSLNPTKSPSRE